MSGWRLASRVLVVLTWAIAVGWVVRWSALGGCVGGVWVVVVWPALACLWSLAAYAWFVVAEAGR